MLPVNVFGRLRGRAFFCVLLATSALATVTIDRAPAQTASPATDSKSDQVSGSKQGPLPQIKVSGQRPKKRGPLQKPVPAAAAPTAPNSQGQSVPRPNVAPVLTGIPATPLNAVAPSSTRLNLPVIETPASVDIITQQTIQDQGYRTTTDVAAGAVGVLAGDSAAAPANFSMRGFTGSQVNILYNGIWTGPADITTRWQDTGNIDHVEILKGPSSLMSGMNAIGGGVNYVTKQPTTGPIQSEFDTSLDSYGSYREHYGSGGSTSLPGLDYRFDASGSKLNSFVEGDFRDLTDLSGQLNYHVTRNFMVWGAVEYQQDAGHAYWGTPLVPQSFAGSNAVSGVVTGTAVNTFTGATISPVTIDSRTLTTNYNIGDNTTGSNQLWLRSGFEWSPIDALNVKNQVFYWRTKASWEDSETYAFDDGTGGLGTNVIDRDRFFVTHNQQMIGDNTDVTLDSRLFGMDNRLASQLQVYRNWITFNEEGDFNSAPPLGAGLYPADAVSVIDPQAGSYGSTGAPSQLNVRISRLTDVAVSFEDRLKITPAFALIGGIRVDDMTQDRSGINGDGTIPGGLPFSQTWKPVSYRAAYTYEPIKDLMFYSMYATAYNPADPNGLFSINGTGTSSLSLTSTRIYESGAKQILWNGRAEWTAAIYDIRLSNVLVPTGPTTADLAGGERTKGAELAGAVSPIDGLKLWANSAWTSSHFTNFDGANGNFSGNILSKVAPIIINGGASYRTTYWRWPVELGFSVRHVGARELDQTNQTTLNSYTTADVYSFVEFLGRDLWMPDVKTVRLTFRIRNVTNAVYAAWSDSSYPDQVILGAPRTYEVAASAKW